jgi:hypothetical protein
MLRVHKSTMPKNGVGTTTHPDRHPEGRLVVCATCGQGNGSLRKVGKNEYKHAKCIGK